jgi:hypothetical protein
MGEQISILDLAIRMIRLHGLRPYQDIDIVETGIRAGEKIEEVLHDEKDTLCDTVHPSIFKLNAHRADISAETFFARIDDLLQENLQCTDAPLARILRGGCPPQGSRKYAVMTLSSSTYRNLQVSRQSRGFKFRLSHVVYGLLILYGFRPSQLGDIMAFASMLFRIYCVPASANRLSSLAHFS